VRNLTAGILLLLKCVLIRHAPAGFENAIIFKDYRPVRQPNGIFVVEGRGKKTVDKHEIEQRLKDFGIQFDWGRLNAIVATRNDMEHFHYSSPASLAKGVFSDALSLITDIIDNQLGQVSTEVFSAKCLAVLKANADAFKHTQQAAWLTFSAIQWESDYQKAAARLLRCDCGSTLVRQVDLANEEPSEIHLECAECSCSLDVNSAFELALSEATYAEAYYAATKGGESPLLPSRSS
jgi:hypothetical protein